MAQLPKNLGFCFGTWLIALGKERIQRMEELILDFLFLKYHLETQSRAKAFIVSARLLW